MAHRSDDDAAVHTVAPNALKPFSQTACPLGCELTVKAQNASFRTIESRRASRPLPRIFDLQLIGRMSPFGTFETWQPSLTMSFPEEDRK
jgi:hypothetical protein